MSNFTLQYNISCKPANQYILLAMIYIPERISNSVEKSEDCVYQSLASLSL